MTAVKKGSSVTIAELREQLKSAQEEVNLFFIESAIEVKSLSGQASKVKNKGVNSADDLKLSGSIVSRINKLAKETEVKRMGVTKIYDQVKNDWIAREREFIRPLTELRDHLIKINNTYTSAEVARVTAEKAKIDSEKKKKIERDSMPAAIKHRFRVAIMDEVASVRQGFVKAWASLNLDNFEERLLILRKYKPKMEYERVEKYLQFNVSYLSSEEVLAQVKLHFNYKHFCEQYCNYVNKIKEEYLSKVEDRRSELNTLTPTELAHVSNKIIDDEINKQVEEKLLQKESEQKLKDSTSQVIMDAEIVAQSKLQALDLIPGRKKIGVYLEGDKIDWQTIVEKYIEVNGTADLQFLLENLTKEQPKITGIRYEEELININRA